MLTVRDAMRLTMADQNRGPYLQRAGQVRWELGESETAMWARVGQLLEDPEAVAAMPAECRRLRGLRDARRGVRSGRRAG